MSFRPRGFLLKTLFSGSQCGPQQEAKPFEFRGGILGNLLLPPQQNWSNSLALKEGTSQRPSRSGAWVLSLRHSHSTAQPLSDSIRLHLLFLERSRNGIRRPWFTWLSLPIFPKAEESVHWVSSILLPSSNYSQWEGPVCCHRILTAAVVKVFGRDFAVTEIWF